MCPTRGQDASPARRLHPGAEPVLLGAMALLGLEGLLHRASERTSRIRPRVENTPKGTQTRLAPMSASARLVRGIIRMPEKQCQTRPAAGSTLAMILPGGIRFRRGRCLAAVVGPVLFFGGPQRRKCTTGNRSRFGGRRSHPRPESRAAGSAPVQGGAGSVSVTILASLHVPA